MVRVSPAMAGLARGSAATYAIPAARVAFAHSRRSPWLHGRRVVCYLTRTTRELTKPVSRTLDRPAKLRIYLRTLRALCPPSKLIPARSLRALSETAGSAKHNKFEHPDRPGALIVVPRHREQS